MRTVKYTYWEDGEFFIGFLNEYPDYQTQGMSKEELMENLKDLLVDLESIGLEEKKETLLFMGREGRNGI